MSNLIEGYEFEGARIKEVDYTDDNLILILEREEDGKIVTHQLSVSPEYHYSRCGDVERYLSTEVTTVY